MSWIARLFKSSRHCNPCPNCEGPIRQNATYCEHCGTWLATSDWLPEGSFNWGFLLERLADLLTEPTQEYTDKVQAFVTALQRMQSEEPATLMAGFADRLKRLSTEDIQKVYRDTFDRTPFCSLELSHHLNPSERSKEKGYPWNLGYPWIWQQLESKKVKFAPYAPDNLIVCLRLLARMGGASGEDLAAIMLPSVSRIVAAMRGTNNPFENLMLTIEWMLTPW
jgi:nitrate reductase assembly molybdenum cofactor insertion protein NarJ